MRLRSFAVSALGLGALLALVCVGVGVLYAIRGSLHFLLTFVLPIAAGVLLALFVLGLAVLGGTTIAAALAYVALTGMRR